MGRQQDIAEAGWCPGLCRGDDVSVPRVIGNPVSGEGSGQRTPRCCYSVRAENVSQAATEPLW